MGEVDNKPNPDAPFLGVVENKVYLADPLNDLQLRVPGNVDLILKKLLPQDPAKGPTYILDAKNPGTSFVPRYTHQLLQSSKVQRLSQLD